ncbi:MAG TPA: alpha/beta hydrolase [Gemmatimonadaceae bacterium]|nr:alpha/beta hydrolase [Gemmatimonadaceae bacterium]
MSGGADRRVTLAERAQYVAARLLGRMPPRVQLALSGGAPVVIDGETLEPQIQLVRAVRSRRHQCGYCEPTPAAGRARLRRETLVFRGPRTEVGAVHDFAVERDAGDGGGSLRLRHYAPSEQSDTLLVYLHGGGCVVGDLDTHDEPCRILCRYAGVQVLAVDYRLAPEHPFPAALLDGRTAFRWALENAPWYGVSRVALGGDSAGGTIAAVLSQAEVRDGAAPAAQLLIYPAADAVTPRPSHELFSDGLFLSREDRADFFRHYLEATGTPRDDPRVSPLLAPDLRGLPPALVVTAGFDILRDEGEAYADAMRAAGVTVASYRLPGLVHGFVNMTGVSPATREAMVRIAKDFRELLDRTRTANPVISSTESCQP